MPLSVVEFTQRLTDCGLMTAESISEFLAATEVKQTLNSGEQLARELVKQKKLTKFQAEQIYAGKEKSLTLGNYVNLLIDSKRTVRILDMELARISEDFGTRAACATNHAKLGARAFYKNRCGENAAGSMCGEWPDINSAINFPVAVARLMPSMLWPVAR
jgi:hypothetical protein